MTWIRWDTGTPRSDVIGFLADRLGLKPVYALGHYNAMCCGFGDHQTDGRIDTVTDSMLELWADWSGRRGRFAAAVREWCAKAEEDGGDPGVLRGWWRQRALLEKQRKDAGKPDGRKGKGNGSDSDDPDIPPKSPQSPPGDSAESRANSSGATNGRTNKQTTTTTPHPRMRAMEQLYRRAVGDRDRHSVLAFVEWFPDDTQEGWSKFLLDCLEGLDLPAGKACTFAELALVCRDMQSKKQEIVNPKFFRTCLSAQMRTVQPLARLSDLTQREAATLEAAAQFVAEGEQGA